MTEASTPQDHAKFSPSGASRWMACPGSVPATAHVERTTNKFADEGTAAHELSAWCLTTERSPWDFEMYEMHIYDGKCATRIDGKIEAPESYKAHTMWVVDQEMIEFVQEYLDVVEDFMQIKNANLMVEKRVDFSKFVNEPSQFGTSDVIITTPDEIIIIDLKYGRGVQVDATWNPQLMMYALGTYSMYSILSDFKTVRMVISQPRKQHLSEFAITVEQLLTFAADVGLAADEVRAAAAVMDDFEQFQHYIRPGEKQCQWCPKKNREEGCTALDNRVLATVADTDFVDMTDPDALQEQLDAAVPHVTEMDEDRLSFCMRQVNLIEGWCKAVRAAVFTKLSNGGEVPGYKMVRGRKGARKWTDEAAAEELLAKSMKLKHADIYTKKLITAPKAITLLKTSKQRLKRVEELVGQADGGLSVAPADDKRPAVEMSEIEFEDLTIEGEE